MRYEKGFFFLFCRKSLKLNINCNLSEIHVHKLFDTVMLSCMFYISRFLNSNTQTLSTSLSLTHSFSFLFRYPPTFLGSDSQRLARYKIQPKENLFAIFRTLCVVYLILYYYIIFGPLLDRIGKILQPFHLRLCLLYIYLCVCVCIVRKMKQYLFSEL